MKIIGLNASPNKTGATFALVNSILEMCAERGADVEMINAAQAVADAKTPFCVCCSTPCSQVCYKGSLLEEAYEKIANAHALIVGSPVYFGSMTAQLKAFFDKTRHIRASKKWIGIPAGALTSGASRYGGQEAAMQAIHNCLLVEGMSIFGPGSQAFDAGHLGVGAQRGADNDDYTKTRCESMAMRALAEAEKYMLTKGI